MGVFAPERADVLIVGAGPAGSALGLLLARAGYRTLILERRPKGYHKVCGDLLGPRSLGLLQSLHVGWPDAGPVRHGIWGILIYDDKELRSSAWFGGDVPWAFTVRRDLFDSFLQAKSVAAGCRIEYETRFKGIRRKAQEIFCEASTREGPRLFQSRVLVGADGFPSVVAKAAGIDDLEPEAGVLAIRGYFRGVRALRDAVELYFPPRIFPGYAWVIPLGPDLANIGIGLRSDVCLRYRVRLAAELWGFLRRHPCLSRRARDAEPVGGLEGARIGTYARGVTRSVPGILLVGDAGRCADPLSGEGVFGALMSARLAAAAIDQMLSQTTRARSALVTYGSRSERIFARAYRYGNFLTGLPMREGIGRSVVTWGLRRIEANCVLDSQYARMVAGFFTGAMPKGRIWGNGWLWRTLFK